MIESENYQQSYVGFPIKESPLLTWLTSINGDPGKFFHLTIYSTGELTNDKLSTVREILISNTGLFKDIILKPQSLETIGIHGKTSVLRIENTPALTELRKLFETTLPEYLPENLDFLPHISIKRKTAKSYLAKIPDMSRRIEAYTPTSVGVFYSPDFMSTALLFTHKL